MPLVFAFSGLAILFLIRFFAALCRDQENKVIHQRYCVAGLITLEDEVEPGPRTKALRRAA